MHLPMKQIRFFNAFISPAAAIDDDHSAPGRIQGGTEPLHHLSSRSLNNNTRSTSHRTLPCESGVISDDSTVLSNASTVKAGTPRKPYVKKQLIPHDVVDTMITTTRSVPTTPSVVTPLKRYKKDHIAASPTFMPTSVYSDDYSPKARRRISFFWSNTRNEKLSQAALQLAQEEHEVARAAQERGRNRQEMLSLPMKRFIVESADMDICTTIAEF
jgi:hypothetical protein